MKLESVLCIYRQNDMVGDCFSYFYLLVECSSLRLTKFNFVNI